MALLLDDKPPEQLRLEPTYSLRVPLGWELCISNHIPEVQDINSEKCSMQEGIKRRFITAYTPQQNGVAERMNITLLERARAMLATVNETDESQAPATRSLNHERRRPGWHSDYVMESNIAYCLLTEEGEPLTLQEALNNPDASFWKEAMQEEIEALHKNKT
ncbi:gag-pol polyprotein [Tanacetum coccineum]